jgi:prephenate dehydrogenase
MTALAIFGVGLIGSSLALALRRRGERVVGIDFENASAADGAFDDRVSVDDEAATNTALAAADVVVLAAPVHAIVAQLPRALRSAKIITDTGSTKRAIAHAAWSQAAAEHFVPGHPMAGDPRGGAERARADLFVGQRWILCPERSAADAVSAVESLVRATGAEIVRLSVE